MAGVANSERQSMDRPESLIPTDLLLQAFFWATYDEIKEQIVAKQK